MVRFAAQSTMPLVWALARLHPMVPDLWIVLGETLYYPRGADPYHPKWGVTRERCMARIKQQRRYGVFWYCFGFLLPPIRWRLERTVYLTVDLLRFGRLPETAVEHLNAGPLGVAWPRRWQLRWFRRELDRRGEP